jgi:flagellar protein FlbD
MGGTIHRIVLHFCFRARWRTENYHVIKRIVDWLMIRLTRLNKSILVVNAELIEFVESTPDTIVTLTTGRKVVVLQSVDEVIDMVVAYKRRFYQNGPTVHSQQ